MRHQKVVKKLDRNHAGRKALLLSQITGLFQHGRIITTPAKAKVVRTAAERLITRARVDSLTNRRYLLKHVGQVAIMERLIKTIAPQYQERQGGYTRIVQLAKHRAGDNATQVRLELISGK